MEGFLIRMLISFRCVNKHGRHRQFLFLVGQFLKIFSSETAWPNKRNFTGSNYGKSSIKKSLKTPKGQSESANRRRTENTMAKRKRTKG